MKKYATLSDEQKKVVNTLTGPVEVIACPGAGKTTIIVERARHLIEHGVNGKKILVITFGSEAAKEMKERYLKVYGNDYITFTTMHSLCFGILKSELGLTKDNIIDQQVQTKFLVNFISTIEEQANRKIAEEVLGEISYVANKQISYKNHPTKIQRQLFLQSFEAYEKYKDENDLFDFDDMLTKTKEILLANEEILEKYQSYFDYIMIDEFQDTNSLQAEIFYALAKKHQNICVVGDDDQSIYKFRAAEPGIMFDFKNHFENTQVLYLSTNYRSTQSIIEKSKNLIETNSRRFEKEFNCFSSEEGLVQKVEVASIKEQADSIIQEVIKLRKQGIDYSQMAILYRTKTENTFITGEFGLKGIPYKSKDYVFDYHDALLFKIVESYYRISNGLEQPGDLKMILNNPYRQLSPQLFSNANCSIQSLYSCAKNATNYKFVMDKVDSLLTDIDMLRGKSPVEFMDYLCNIIGLKESMFEKARNGYADLDMTRQTFEVLENEAQLFNSMDEWLIYSDGMRKNLKIPSAKDGINLMTMHGSKGLEYKVVFIINVNEDYIPSQQASSWLDIEEERRLMYVAMTRAKEKLYIYSLNEKSGRNPSRFIKDAKI